MHVVRSKMKKHMLVMKMLECKLKKYILLSHQTITAFVVADNSAS